VQSAKTTASSRGRKATPSKNLGALYAG
jgi:hypothetical protein